MNEETPREEIVRFLLGEMDAAEREEFEVRLFEDPDLFFDAAEVENSLADGYARGTLPDEERFRLANASERLPHLNDKLLEAEALKILVESEERKERAGLLARMAGLFSEWFGGATAFWTGIRLAGAMALVVILASGTYFLFISLRNPSQVALNELPEGTEEARHPEVTFSPSPVVKPSVATTEPEKVEVPNPSPIKSPKNGGQKSLSPTKKRPSRSLARLTERKEPVPERKPPKKDEPLPESAPPPTVEEPTVLDDVPAAAAQGYPTLDYEERKNDGYVNRIFDYFLDLTTDRPRLRLLDPGLPPDTKVSVFMNGEPAEVLIRLPEYFLIAVDKSKLKREGINRFELKTEEGKSYHYNLKIIE